MAATRTMQGQRAQVIVDGQIVGTVNSISFNYTYDLRNIDILGRSSTAEIVNTGFEPIEITVSGYRCVDAGPQVSLRIPTLQNLMTVPYVEFAVIDRVTGRAITKVHNCRSSGASESCDSKGIWTFNAHFRGLLYANESFSNFEGPNAVNLPPS